MMEKFNNKYRIASARAQWWDYRWDAAYFVTICTQKREHFFGEIENGTMQLSDIGQIANNFWEQIPDHFSFVRLGKFIIMPNHVHGIIIIDKTEYIDDGRDVACNVSTTGEQKNEQMAKISPKFYSLSSIIRSYKSAVTRRVRPDHSSFAWQPRFHDHIIRDEREYCRISKYIENNPAQWKGDKFYTS